MIIGSYIIHPGVIWENEMTQPAAAQQMTRTMLGNVDIKSVPLLKREMVFSTKDSGSKSRGYFEREVIDFLREAELNGTVVVVIYRGVSYNLIVKSGGVNVAPKKETESVDGTDPCTGSITFYNT